jgi:hypothetical protein
MLGLGDLFKGGDASDGGVTTLERSASTSGPLPPGSVEGIPRTFYDGYTAEDGNMAKNEQGFYYLKEDKRDKLNPFEKVRRWPLPYRREQCMCSGSCTRRWCRQPHTIRSHGSSRHAALPLPLWAGGENTTTVSGQRHARAMRVCSWLELDGVLASDGPTIQPLR